MRGFYKDIGEIKNIEEKPFRPEFFWTNKDAVYFLNRKYGTDEKKIISTLQSVEAKQVQRESENGSMIQVYKVERYPESDYISKALSLDGSYLFVLHYEDGKLVDLSSES